MLSEENSTPLTDSTDASGMVMGKITAPEGLQLGLIKVRNGPSVQYGVLLVFSKEIKGRLGIFNNRVITGATLEPSGEQGIAAVRRMLAVNSGMFGFRAAIADEVVELQQKLLLDLDVLLNSSTAATVPPYVPPPEPPPATALDAPEDAAPASDRYVQTETTEVDPNYLAWLRDEREKVFDDIEKSIARSSHRGTAPSPDASAAAEAINDLRMVSEMLQSEQDRAQRWQGLDEIPTPLQNSSGPLPVVPTPGVSTSDLRKSLTRIPAGTVKMPSADSAVKTSGRFRQPFIELAETEETTGSDAEDSDKPSLWKRVLSLFKRS